MNVDESLAILARQMEAQSRMAILWIVVSVLLLALSATVLILLLRMRRRNQKVEDWLVREMATLQDAQAPAAVPPPSSTRSSAKVPRSMPQKTAPRRPQADPADLIPTLNEMLAGNQPYNFIEAVRALQPGLELHRLTPCAGGDVFAKEVILETGGDGLFAAIEGDTALLFPNYSRFSATLDPKPLFEGARHGGRIHSILSPAILSRQGGDTWMLTQRGRVQMRQGN